MKTNKLSIATLALLAIVMLSCKQTAASDNGEKNTEVADSETQAQQPATDSTTTASTDVTASPAEPLLTFAQAKTMVTPGQLHDEQSIESLFTKMQLSKVQAERYISDLDYGGDSPAISYTWGKNVEFKNWKLQPKANGYYGTHFNLFFDKTRKTGTLRQIEVITDSVEWYNSFMAAAKTAGMELKGNIDKAVYLRDGKEYSLKIDESSQYYLIDYSSAGQYDVELGFDDGIDV